MEEEEKDGEERLRKRREEINEEERHGEKERLRRRVESRSERANVATINDRIYLGSMARVCQHYQALRFLKESLSCHNGKVSLLSLEDTLNS